MISKKRLSRQFDRAVSPQFQREVLLLIDKCYRAADAAKDTYGLHAPIFWWLRPLLRRSLIQSQVFELAQTFGLNPAWRETRLGGNPYVRITAGKFVLTESKISTPGELPDYADYRSSNCGFKYSLFEEGSRTGDIYGIIAHVPHPREARPEFVYVVFPDMAYTRVIHEFDLTARFGHALMRSQIDETKAVDPQPKLRTSEPGDRKAQA